MTDPSAATLAAEKPITRTFLETLFCAQREDIAALWRDMVADVKGIKQVSNDMGQRLDTLEAVKDQQEDELNAHQQELLELHDKSEELYYHLEKPRK
ncbi:hypothetical protein NDU88_003135 [Pleurodeles waltl]|uniref:Uncharacterized protein n=1 Tax=Pleurodeles waltl TaxID=8319 RepID=A0AAV7LHR1_PLEWA|nr:hypothetical protein NDU88_003135 [Pleurodeles waltl]